MTGQAIALAKPGSRGRIAVAAIFFEVHVEI
jgi:hypothetical protein